MRYPFVEGCSYSPSVDGWIKILRQIKTIHELNFVHGGDPLPRNVLFGGDNNGFVIDFDLSRKEGDCYVRGYNHADFDEFRHEGAKAGAAMKKDHDLYSSLRKMSSVFFDLQQEDELIDHLNLDGLINFFTGRPRLARNVYLDETHDDAGGSPDRPNCFDGQGLI